MYGRYAVCMGLISGSCAGSWGSGGGRRVYRCSRTGRGRVVQAAGVARMFCERGGWLDMEISFVVIQDDVGILFLFSFLLGFYCFFPFFHTSSVRAGVRGLTERSETLTSLSLDLSEVSMRFCWVAILSLIEARSLMCSDGFEGRSELKSKK